MPRRCGLRVRCLQVVFISCQCLIGGQLRCTHFLLCRFRLLWLQSFAAAQYQAPVIIGGFLQQQL